jgi:hypothetical protein
MRWIGLRGLAVPAVLVLAACTTANFKPYTEMTFPPTTEVEVLLEEPSEPYEVLGELWVDSEDTEGVLKMRQKAMEIGADAIIMVGEVNVGAVAIPIEGVGAVAVPLNRTYSVAIRYERESSQAAKRDHL